MNITRNQLKDLIASAIKQQVASNDVNETKTRLTREELKGMVREMMEKVISEEETRDGHNYEEFFRTKMKEMFGTESLDDLSDKQRKEFFSAVDHDWKARDESINESGKMCEQCGMSEAKCECNKDGEVCEACGEEHDEMTECGVDRGITTVMDEGGEEVEEYAEGTKEVTLERFKGIVRQMIIEESLDIKKFLNEEFHARGDSDQVYREM